MVAWESSNRTGQGYFRKLPVLWQKCPCLGNKLLLLGR